MSCRGAVGAEWNQLEPAVSGRGRPDLSSQRRPATPRLPAPGLLYPAHIHRGVLRRRLPNEFTWCKAAVGDVATLRQGAGGGEQSVTGKGAARVCGSKGGAGSVIVNAVFS